ncbi:aspartate aminotransferase family protein [Saccharolobus caldissimus]|uniref:Glutamate-1-semialdehyde 2,1-aminomutase n=1 Tax=Saccharolobus caldissimus TaxID=1702097 RepID=A0AAQ4CUC6_9CREN|nr:aspartate aminotransferase family protein [Saccharolobus caldissimus]BDB99407.1 glutamate-1-semialdehyde 2,1-aminomutase [Saccharolobus caldissimus]
MTIIDNYRKYTSRSLSLYREARSVMPYGVSSNYRYWEPYPIYLVKGKGSRVWDVDGNEYIDFNMGFGVLEVGHSHPRIVEEVRRAVEDSTILGFEYEKSVELAKIICNRYNVDMVRFSSTGTEATMHAIRIARAYTKRKKIIKFEGHYHGSHDQLLINVNPMRLESRVPTSPGIPEETLSNTLVADWNDYEGFERLVRVHGNDVAAVIMEPVAMNMGLIPADLDFLKGVFDLARDYGFLVIFDEVKTGGKFYSGASGYYGLKPDLVTLGKAIAGGLPLSVVAGRRDVLGVVGPGRVAHGGTFNANPLSVRVAIVTLRDILTEGAFYYMNSLSEELQKGYEDIADDLDIDLIVNRWGVSGTIIPAEIPPKNYKEIVRNTDFKTYSLYFYSMLTQKIIPMAYQEQWTISIAHTSEDIRNHIEKAYDTFKLIKSRGSSIYSELNLPDIEETW